MKKPTAPTTTPARQQAAKARTGNAPHTELAHKLELQALDFLAKRDADAEHRYGSIEAQRIGRFVRRAAGDIATCIEKSLNDLGGLLLAVDGECQAGLHDLREAIVTLHPAFRNLQAAIANTKCRGEHGHRAE